MEFVVCINNQNYLASLEVRKIYQILPDVKVTACNMIRIVDESGEDYLDPNRYFLPIELPESTKQILTSAR
ncbi:hypothetical protein IQ249_16410 [Lusitaniella coriacea LEGE 07157]|uniref:Uncharacterized protein n=1 Tax=Lusitaniella coriacea LEGE 07157 TaxID=945747 RepID=A0A8J7DYI0_9CYAN|nr:hypothetical protein [Lusitaniella coriacea]MBE9117485.1 hypothetical protein [Lusitaniella coriacea LEGE 07157]